MFVAVDVYGLIAWLTFTYWQLSPNRSTSTSSTWYDEKRTKIACSPPGWLFGVAWTILFALIATSAFMYSRNYDENNDYYISVIVLLVVNIFLNKLWSLVFFDNEQSRVGLALFIALGMFATEIAILVLMGLTAAWTEFGLFAPYAVWTLFAIYLNLQWYRKGLGFTEKKNTTPRTKVREPIVKKGRTVRHRVRPTTVRKETERKKDVIINFAK